MDITLIRTFLEVSATGSFISAAQRLFVTQSAVSLRIQRLEDELGQPLFRRSRAGAVLTAAGSAFAPHAQALVRVWEDARRQIAIPAGFEDRLSIGAQDVLWPRLGFPLIDALRKVAPRLSLHAISDTPDRLIRALIEGAVQIAVMHAPPAHIDLTRLKLLDDELIHVSGAFAPVPAATEVEFDWGADFTRARRAAHPSAQSSGAQSSGLALSLGAQARDFLLAHGHSGYLPAGAITADLGTGRLRRLRGTPAFPYPVHAVWRADHSLDAINVAVVQLKKIASGRSESPRTSLDALP